MKVVLNPMFEQARGSLGELVFREVNGQTFASRKPTITGEPSAEQLAQRERFRQAAIYAKGVMSNPTLRPLYEAVAESRGIPISACAIADFFNRPTVQSVNLSMYHGQIGDPIEIIASDDVGVVEVRVTLADALENVIETGLAVETVPGSNHWIYTATALATGPVVNVHTVAKDRPGNAGTNSQSVTL